jgi:hypothetical protein
LLTIAGIMIDYQFFENNTNTVKWKYYNIL